METQTQEISKLEEKLIEPYALVVHNDDYNTFDHVILCLETICGHNHQQALQCTLMIHYSGSCDVKRGDFESLTLMKEKLISKSLSCTVEQL